MKRDTLETGNSIVREIEKYKGIRALTQDNGSHIGIKSSYGDGDKDSKFIPEEIKGKIIECCDSRIKELEAQLEEL